MDLATANSTLPGTVSALLGDGSGLFTMAPSLVVGDQPVSAVATGDFNGDGNLDLAVNAGNDTVSVALGDGVGNFSLASFASVAPATSFMAVGDFNGDGNLDLAGISEGIISILLGNGKGNLTPGPSVVGRFASNSIAVGDFSGDGKLDLAVGDGDEDLCMLLGDGTGNFNLTSCEYSGIGPAVLVAGDFTGEDKLDVAAANYCGEEMGYDCNPGTLSLFLVDGAGNLMGYSPFRIGGYRPNSMVAGDFNGDGKLDLAIADSVKVVTAGSNMVSILLGTAPGTSLRLRRRLWIVSTP